MHKKSGFQQFLTSWHLWIMVALVIGLILFRNVIGDSIFLLAIVLICPIMMMFMMGGHDHK